MENKLRSNFIMSSNLLFVTLGFIISGFVVARIFNPIESNSFLHLFINLVFVGGMGFLVRQGSNWSKFLPLSLMILYMIEGFSLLIDHDIEFLPKVIFIMQSILVAWATLILFVNFQKKEG